MKVLLRDREVAELFGVCRRTVWSWASTGRLPQPVEIGGKVKRWRMTDLQEMIDGLRPADGEAA